MILLIDNYDSFSYNLYQAVGEINQDVRVIRNDMYSVSTILQMNPTHIILSPGPGHPKEAGICTDIVLACKGKLPILGVCLGHQVICEAFGGTVVHASEIVHGEARPIHIANGSALFKGLAPIISVGRYHSLTAKRSSLPDELYIIAENESNDVMAVKHRDYEIYGVQFHPESILTPDGQQMIANFLQIREEA